MIFGWAVFFERLPVAFCAITEVAIEGEIVNFCITPMQFGHDSVASDFGDNARGGDGRRASIAAGNRGLWQRGYQFW